MPLVIFGIDLDVQYFFGIAVLVPCNISHVPIIINNLHFLHNIGRKILCRCLNITSKEVFAINSDPLYRFTLRGNIPIFIDFNAL
ncbi:hypothetical protein D3C72_1447490 [compost metagenome]